MSTAIAWVGVQCTLFPIGTNPNPMGTQTQNNVREMRGEYEK